MGQQLLFAAVLAGFSAGIVITWLVFRSQVESYKNQTATILSARDEMLQHVRSLSRLIQHTKTGRFDEAIEINLRALLAPIESHLQDLQERVATIEAQETALAHRGDKLVEVNDWSRGEADAHDAQYKSTGTAAASPMPRDPNGKNHDSSLSPGLLRQLIRRISDDHPKHDGSDSVEHQPGRLPISETGDTWERSA